MTLLVYNLMLVPTRLNILYIDGFYAFKFENAHDIQKYTKRSKYESHRSMQ